MDLRMLSKEDILALDSRLFSDSDKRDWLRVIYGDPAAWTWKEKLNRAPRELARARAILSPLVHEGLEYRVGHSQLLIRARRCRPTGGLTVSAFANWIYRLYVPERDVAALAMGEKVEREIVRQYIRPPEVGGWKLIHNGILDRDEHYSISALTVAGQAMKASPDFVFREKATGRILVVEAKATNVPIPSDGWPNLRAQLWAYSHIDAFHNAPEVLLVAEIWAARLPLKQRAVRSFPRDARDFGPRNAQLFEIYRQWLESAPLNSDSDEKGL